MARKPESQFGESGYPSKSKTGRYGRAREVKQQGGCLLDVDLFPHIRSQFTSHPHFAFRAPITSQHNNRTSTKVRTFQIKTSQVKSDQRHDSICSTISHLVRCNRCDITPRWRFDISNLLGVRWGRFATCFSLPSCRVPLLHIHLDTLLVMSREPPEHEDEHGHADGGKDADGNSDCGLHRGGGGVESWSR